MRDSTSLKMIPYLCKKGAKVRYYDPTGKKQEFDRLKNVQFKNNIKEACISSDLIIIHTEWNEFKLIDLKKMVSKKNFIVYDLRNIYSPEKMKKQKIKYFGIGR